jgi:hypothetical protein
VLTNSQVSTVETLFTWYPNLYSINNMFTASQVCTVNTSCLLVARCVLDTMFTGSEVCTGAAPCLLVASCVLHW